MSGLIQINDPVVVFSENKIDEVLAEITEAATSLVFDIETSAGRAECKSTAMQVTKVKTFLDNAGKELVSDWKQKARGVDQQRKQIRDTLDAVKVAVRSPLTAYEDEIKLIESKRMAMSKRFMNAKMGLSSSGMPLSANGLDGLLFELKALGDFREFGKDAERELTMSHGEAMTSVRTRIEEAKKLERDAEELARLKKLEAEMSSQADKLLRDKADADAKRVQELEAEVAESKAGDERKKNKAHRDQVLVETRDALEALGLSVLDANNVVTEVYSGNIKHLSIHY